MIAADTNVLLRHVLQDDAAQSSAASAFFAARSRHDPAFVSAIVLVEFAWALRRRYRVPQDDLAQVVRSLLRSEEVVLEAASSVRRALDDAAESGTDLADAIIAQRAIDAGCDGTVTFDRRAQRLPGMLPVG